jgi:hypothetical protein
VPKVGELKAGDFDRATFSEKVAYVVQQRQTRNHQCHWPGCDKQVPPALWGCYRHWRRLPKHLRDLIWKTYVPGQEKTLTPSEEYLLVAHKVQLWIKENYPW